MRVLVIPVVVLISVYEGLDSCWAYYKQANQHWDISQVGQPMTPGKKEALDRYLALPEKYFYDGELFCVRPVFTEVSYWVKNGMAYRPGSLFMLPGASLRAQFVENSCLRPLER